MEEKSHYHNDVMFSALSGLLFFGFVVQYSLKKDVRSRGEDEKEFVKSWCSVGNYLFVLLLFFFFSVIVFEISAIGIFSVFAQVFGFIILFIVFLSFPLILSGKSIQFYDLDITEEQKMQVVLSFIPFFSSYCWFSSKHFDDPNFCLKEAQIWFLILWILLYLFNSWMVGLVFFGFLILRVGLLLGGKDFFSSEQKQRMKHWFLVYPEESFSVIFTFVRQGFSLLFGKKGVSVEELLKYQESYRLQWNLKTYLLTLLFGCGIAAFVFYWCVSGLYWKIVPIIWIIIRGGILLLTKMRIPKIPLVAELTA